jgi:hypothetical protein
LPLVVIGSASTLRRDVADFGGLADPAGVVDLLMPIIDMNQLIR